MSGDVHTRFERQIHTVNVGSANLDGAVNHARCVVGELDGNNFVRARYPLIDVEAAVFGFDRGGPLRHGRTEPAVSFSQHHRTAESRGPPAPAGNITTDV